MHSDIEATKNLLAQCMEFSLTERLNQDCVGEYFGCQRGSRCHNDSPSITQFGYNDNTIRMQRSVVPVSENTRGAHKSKWRVDDETPLPKRMKQS